MNVTRVENEGELLALIVSSWDSGLPIGVNFITEPTEQVQVATIRRPPGHRVPPHHHPPQKRQVFGTPEVLVVQKGGMIARFYVQWLTEPVAVHLVGLGDIVILLRGGHGFEVGPKGVELVEVKQGPYVKGLDKESHK